MPSPSRRRLTAGEQVVRDALRRRGLSWNGERDPTPLLVPTGAARLRHYALLGHYSYRLFLRDVLRRPTDLRATALTRYTTAAVAARYLRFLAAARLVEPSGRGRYRLREPHGGDYDVVACAEGEVLYVETKSAPPRQIVESEVRAFLDRVDTLRPDCALFLADTTLRMRDKLVGLFAAEVTRRRLAWDEPARIERELWRVGPEIYLLNSDPDLVRNMGVCLAVHFRGRGVAVG